MSPLGITTTIPANYTAERGDNVTFSCLTPAGPDTMYVWLYTADESLCIGCSDDVSLDSILDCKRLHTPLPPCHDNPLAYIHNIW